MPHESPLQFQLGLIFPHDSVLFRVLVPSCMVRPHWRLAIVLSILNVFQEVGQHPGLNLLCFSHHDCQVAIYKGHAIQLIIHGWLT